MRVLSRMTIAFLMAVVCAQALLAGADSVDSRRAAVFGYVWNAENEPIGSPQVRLRNVTSGAVDAVTTGAENGEFRFQGVNAGTYVIEYIDPDGKVLATGHVFSVAPGETVATFIRLGHRKPWFAALIGNVGNAAATAVASAASLGVTALAPASRPVSRER